MTTDPHAGPPEGQPAPAPEPSTPTGPPRGSASGRAGWLIVPIVSVAAGLIAWGLGETPVVRVEPAESNLVVMGQVTETIATTPESIREADRLSSIRSLAIFGALMGLGLGGASGLSVLGRKAAVIAGAVGLVAGGMLGGLAPLAALPLYEAMRTPGSQDLLPVLLMHVALWAPIGAASGLAFGLGRTSSPGALVGSAITGAVGASIGAVLFQVVGTLAFPLSGVDKLWPETTLSRLASRLTVAVGIGLVVASTGASASGRPGPGPGPA